MNKKIIERLFEYLDFIGVPHTRFEKEIGLSNGYLSTQRRRKADLGESVIQKIIDNSLQLNPMWLILGKGDMLGKDNLQAIIDKADAKIPHVNKVLSLGAKGQKIAPNIAPNVAPNTQNDGFLPNSQGNISIIDAKAAAGMAAIIEQPQLYNQLPSFSLPMPATRLGAFICIEVCGDSMHPTVKDGEWVIAQQIQEASNIKNGYIHIILTTEGLLCKRLYYEQGKEHLKLVSDNDIYSPTKLPLEDTIAIYKSIMKLSSDFRNWNNDLRRQINLIDARLTALEVKKK
jgi:repressor LexA